MKKRKEGNEQKKGSVMRQPPGKKICFGRRTGFKGERGEVGVTQVERLGAKTGGKNKNDSRGKKISST